MAPTLSAGDPGRSRRDVEQGGGDRWREAQGEEAAGRCRRYSEDRELIAMEPGFRKQHFLRPFGAMSTHRLTSRSAW